MIIIVTPFSFEKNLGKAYNEAMNLLPSDDDWAIITDIDILFMDNKAPFHFKKAIELFPETGIFTCPANRTGRGQQKYKGELSKDANIINHRKIAIKEAEKFRVKDITEPIAGYIMAIRKGVWKSVGGFKEAEILGIDLDFSKKVMAAGYTIKLIESVYIFHYYRLLEGGPAYREHLK